MLDRLAQNTRWLHSCRWTCRNRFISIIKLCLATITIHFISLNSPSQHRQSSWQPQTFSTQSRSMLYHSSSAPRWLNLQCMMWEAELVQSSLIVFLVYRIQLSTKEHISWYHGFKRLSYTMSERSLETLAQQLVQKICKWSVWLWECYTDLRFRGCQRFTR